MFRTRSMCCCFLCTLLGLALAWLMFFGAAPAAYAQPKGPVSFINDVAPILKENCFACHDAKKKKGKLEITSYDTFRKGGSRDEPFTPGNSKGSLIIELLSMTTKGRMPPLDVGEALPKEKIAIIAKWIDEGAKLDAGVDAKADLLRELRVRWKPPQPAVTYTRPALVTALAFTPDNKRIVADTGNHELTVWDAATGKLQRRIFTRAERAHAMIFLPDGKLAVAGSRPGQEGDVRIYNIDAGKTFDFGGVPAVDGANDPAVMVKELVQTDDEIFALALSPDGKKLASGGCDRLVRVWDLASGKLEHSIENHADWVLGVAFTPDGKGLATASRDKTAKVWDLAGKESLLTFPDHQDHVYAVAITADGKTGISIGSDKNIRSWQATDAAKAIGKQVKVLGSHGDAVFRMAYRNDAKNPLLATGGADKSVKLWNPVSGAALKTLAGFTDWVYAVAISPNGEFVAGGSGNGEVRVFKAADGTLVTSFNAAPGYTPPKAAEVKK
jgi:WD40 repeat protein